MIAHPHTLPDGPCPGARTFGITVRNCVRCGALLDNGDTRMTTIHGPRLPSSGDLIRMRMTDLRVYCGPFITRSGMRVRPSYPALGRRAVTMVPTPADLHYPARER